MSKGKLAKFADMEDAFFIDITDIHKFQTHFKAMNHKLAMALEAADHLPW